MENREQIYKSLMSVKSLTGFTTEKSLEHIGLLIDLSFDLHQKEGLKHPIRLSEELQKRQITSYQSALLNYFLANAWANLRLLRQNSSRVWDWEQQEMEMEIFHLRSASKEDGFSELPKERQCQILTNLANLLDHIGRFVEAIEYWDRALGIIPSFTMARGNRAIGLIHYTRALYDKGHTLLFLKSAHTDLKTALSSPLYKNARKSFEKYQNWVESVLSPESIDKDVDMHAFSLGSSKQETQYRQWCLNNRLFLNPLNDLGPYPIGARDILTAPSIVVDLGKGPYYPAYFNQIKQEFVSARYLYYEAVTTKQTHFSDRDVLLYNTLDYPSYSLAVEKTKVVFRMTYSLFDKIAYFLNHYLNLSILEKRVSFKTFWYVSRKKTKSLRPDLKSRRNWPLRGLFWLSKDLYEDKPGFKKSIEPDAQELSEIRNHLEHKYLKLHDDLWSGPPSQNNNKTSLALADTLAFSLHRRDFEAKTLRLMKMIRAALIYLSLAIHYEEQQRAKERDPNKVVSESPLDIWKDEWKI